MLNNLSTKMKLMLLPMFFVIIVVSATVIFNHFDSISVKRANASLQTELFIQKVLKGRINVYQFLRNPSISNANKVIESFQKLNQKVLLLKNNLNVPKNRDLCDKIILHSNKYIIHFNDFALKRIKQYQKGILLEDEFLTKSLKPMIEIGLELERELTYINESAVKLQKEAISDLKNTLFIMVVVSILLFISFSLVLSNIIIKSLNDFQEGLLNFFRYISKEIETVELLDNSNKDEFGLMSKSVNANILKTKNLIEQDNVLINEAKIVINKVKHGVYTNIIQSNTDNSSLNAFKDEVNEMIKTTKQHFVSMNAILDEYSKYDYRKSLELLNINKDGEFSLLVTDINALKDSINEMLCKNKSNGLTLDESSNILLHNVNKLNNNSNEAAASLEETAAALEEITSNISSNTQTIMKMAECANELTTSSNKGKELANQTTTAMNEIDVEVNSISEAITVIDQIAFQTNILSLNAAVEAATAGEAGKGFAVVAQEVRNLASRSADAANEIKTLVEKATQKAETGKSIANKMIDGYTGLNNNISHTIELIKDVEFASKEQLQGIEQINDAVNSLDTQTQENANIASQTKDVAIQTDAIAKLVVSNANEKEFIGKDSVEAKEIEAISPKSKNQSNKTSKSKIKQITSNNTTDEWASF